MPDSGVETRQTLGDEELELLILQTLGVDRTAPAQRSAPAYTPHEDPADPVPGEEASFTAEQGSPEFGSPVEPLRLKSPQQTARVMLMVVFPLIALGIGGWLASDRIKEFLQIGGLPVPSGPPIIAAPPPAARMAAPAQPLSPPPAPQIAPQPQAAPPPQPGAGTTLTAAPPAADGPPIAAIAAADSAGILGSAPVSPFDHLTAPKPVRTTAILPPRPAAPEAPATPIDFDNPSTWPPGAEKAEPHPLPPRRAR